MDDSEGDESAVVPLAADLELVEAALPEVVGQINLRCGVVEEFVGGEIAIRVSIEMIGSPDAPGDPEIVHARGVVWESDCDVFQALVSQDCPLSFKKFFNAADQLRDKLTYLPRYFAHTVRLNVASARNMGTRKIMMLDSWVALVVALSEVGIKTIYLSSKNRGLAQAAIYAHPRGLWSATVP